MSLPSSKRPTLLVTAAGTAAGYGLLTAARRHHPDVRLIAGDINPRELCAASVICDLFVQTVGVSDPAFEESLAAVTRDEGVTAYIPIIDEEIIRAARFASVLGVRVAVPSETGADVCFDKLKTYQFLKAHGLPTVETLVSEVPLGSLAGPLIAKPRRGRGSLGFRLLETASDLSRLEADLVVQPQLCGPEITVDAFLAPDAFRAVCRERVETKAGVCTKARVFMDPDLEQLVERIGTLLGLRGTYCVQFMHDAEGQRLVTDINPRPGAGTAISDACGVELLAAHVADALGRDPSPFLKPLARERYVVRVFSEIVTQ